MIEHIALKGLWINDQSVLAPLYALSLMTTACPEVLKLSWVVWHEDWDQHLCWLLSRLRALEETPQPWWWTSHNPDAYGTPVRFRAWLTSPIGYESHENETWLLMRTFFLHVHLAPDGAVAGTAPQVCPRHCTHTGLRDTQVHRPIGGENGPER